MWNMINCVAPAGVGPFPVVIYMGMCVGINRGEEHFLATTLRDRLLSKGIAILIVDSYWPRQEWQGVCDKWNGGAVARRVLAPQLPNQTAGSVACPSSARPGARPVASPSTRRRCR
jgi:dienelactone hydrolase